MTTQLTEGTSRPWMLRVSVAAAALDLVTLTWWVAHGYWGWAAYVAVMLAVTAFFIVSSLRRDARVRRSSVEGAAQG